MLEFSCPACDSLNKMHTAKHLILFSFCKNKFFSELVVLRLLLVSALLLLSFLVQAESDAGLAKVVDGDGLIINGLEHRLHGIDAVEVDQSCQDRQGKVWLCGQRAREVLQSLVSGENVECHWSDKDRWGRRLSTCRINGTNLNAAMVFTGYAVAYRLYSERYVLIEKEARDKQNGIWQGEFVIPSEHRLSLIHI